MSCQDSKEFLIGIILYMVRQDALLIRDYFSTLRSWYLWPHNDRCCEGLQIRLSKVLAVAAVNVMNVKDISLQ